MVILYILHEYDKIIFKGLAGNLKDQNSTIRHLNIP